MSGQPGFAQDPGELFDVVRADGSPTGLIKTRAAVHRDGDWHRAIHLWVAGRGAGGEPFLLFQRRSPEKDTWPDRLDATVGGHLGAGETVHDALREVHEEIGIHPDPARVIELGTRVVASESGAGVRDREVQSILLLRDDRPLQTYHPNPAEVAAIVRFPLPVLLDFLAGDHDDLAGVAMPPGGDPRPVRARREDFVPNVDRDFYRVAIAAAAAIRGE
ncbi:MAG: NUDIX hydrolase, partial [Chloroflexota bacterium]